MSPSCAARSAFVAACLIVSTTLPAFAQNADRGFTMPFTVNGGLMVSERGRSEEPEAGSTTAGFRAVLYPGVKLSERWFAYSAIDIKAEPFSYYEAFYPEREIETTVDQLFLGYRLKRESTSLTLKAGKLASAFGAFPLRYDDRHNPLLDQPPAYAYGVELRPDQIPCSVYDIAYEHPRPPNPARHCGGSMEERDDIVPVSLYGVNGAEADLTWKRMDARLQLTNSSPANPQSLASDNQHPQWTAGAGFTIAQGFRVGMSAYRGAFLERNVDDVLPSGADSSDYPAGAIGADVQWARGRFSANGEWQRFSFTYPGFVSSPVVSSAYAELKVIVNPRIYGAARVGYMRYHRVEDSASSVEEHFRPNTQSYEAALGYHLNRAQTVKAGYEWFKAEGVSGRANNVFGIQFVTSINALSKAF